MRTFSSTFHSIILMPSPNIEDHVIHITNPTHHYTTGLQLPTPSITPPLPIFIAADSTGETAQKVIKAVLHQFAGHNVNLRVFPEIADTESLIAVYNAASVTNALVVTSLVNRAHREIGEQHAKAIGVTTIALFGELLDHFEAFLKIKPQGVPGLTHLADEHYFKRIEAIEFTVKADDGKDDRLLEQADIVLVGVSRTSKTPLSTYLAHQGYKVGNVPIFLGKEPPDTLYNLDQHRIFALTISPSMLESIRKSRVQTMGLSMYDNYAESAYIMAELEYSQEIFASNPVWPIIDVTNRAIEESAARIISIMDQHGFQAPNQ
jgi:regulator of PEP synthase PpsR (kinase-PPPase family)